MLNMAVKYTVWLRSTVDYIDLYFGPANFSTQRVCRALNRIWFLYMNIVPHVKTSTVIDRLNLHQESDISQTYSRSTLTLC